MSLSSTTIFHFLLRRKVFETYQVYYSLTYCFRICYPWTHFLSYSMAIFFRWLDYKSLLSRFSALINYIVWSYNLFFCIQLFPTFFMVQVFMVLVFQGPGFSGSRFYRVWVQGLGPCFRSSPTLVHIFS